MRVGLPAITCPVILILVLTCDLAPCIVASRCWKSSGIDPAVVHTAMPRALSASAALDVLTAARWDARRFPPLGVV